jgi:class 3 adenylate cyclase
LAAGLDHMPNLSRLRIAALLYVAFFAVTAAVQYGFVVYRLDAERMERAQSDARQLNDALRYDHGLDAEAYDSVTNDVTEYVNVLNDGTILEVAPAVSGLPTGLLPPVVSPVLAEAAFKSPMTIAYQGGTTHPIEWMVMAKHLSDGVFFAGIPGFKKRPDKAELLVGTLDRLAPTVARVNRDSARGLDPDISWALIDDEGQLINGWGTPPLKTDATEVGRDSEHSSYRILGGARYFLHYAPITDQAGKRVGTMILFQDLESYERTIAALRWFDGTVGALSALVFVALTAVFARRNEREKRAIQEAFQNYFSPQIMEAILKEPDRLKLGGQRREVTVLFADIRSFTTIAERLPPQQLTRLLQEYFGEMAEAVSVTDGILDKYIGDAIMAFWGAPIDQVDQADRAVRTAVDMRHRLDRLRMKWASEGLPELDIGIGINLGVATVGNFGSARRYDYTIIGDTVNAASRLEALNKDFASRIIISASTKAQLTIPVETRDLGEVQVRGKETLMHVYEVLS